MIILAHHEMHHEFVDLAGPAVGPFSVKVLLTYEFMSLQTDLFVGGILDDLGNLEKVARLKPLIPKAW